MTSHACSIITKERIKRKKAGEAEEVKDEEAVQTKEISQNQLIVLFTSKCFFSSAFLKYGFVSRF